MTNLIATLQAIWTAAKWMLSFLSAAASILGMLATGLAMALSGDFLGGALVVIKALFTLCAVAFGWHLTTTGVQVSMGPLVPKS